VGDDYLQSRRGRIKGGLTECHELKIIEIIARVLAGVSVLATIPVMNSIKRHKNRKSSRTISNV
jgi:hypothetical protein